MLHHQEKRSLRATFTATGAILACLCLLFAAPTAHAQGIQEYTSAPAFQGEDVGQKTDEDTPKEALKKEASRLAREAKERVQSFAEYADTMLQGLSEPRGKGWVVFGLTALLSLISLLWGWTLIQSLLIPFAPVWGLATGGFTAFCIVEAFYLQRPPWFRLGLFAVGITLGVGLYLFAALRAKPVAAFLVILSPFLMISAFLFHYNIVSGVDQVTIWGVVVLVAGVAAAFAAMVQVRPLAILSTSILGAVGFLACWGLLSHLMSGKAAFVADSFEWLSNNPLMLILGWGVLTFLGTNVQFITGPRGTLEE